MHKSVLVTGGAGFIGSHVVRQFVRGHDYQVVNLDALTYAGDLSNLADLADASNYHFVQGDIGDFDLLGELFQKYDFWAVLNLAAESHVDRSIASPFEFVRTNVLGTTVLLETARQHWRGRSDCRFYQISTDEVYGSLGADGRFSETTPYAPRSPYAASKASADHLVRAYHETYGLPIVLSNCSNNYGPNQYPEKLIPVCITRLLEGQSIPVYGKGENVRDWLYVEDHAQAIDTILHRGRPGQTYNIGGACELRNLDLVKQICQLVDESMGREPGTSARQIEFVTDRLGHDFRYAVDFSKLTQELGWRPATTFAQGLRRTVDWYLDRAAVPQ